MPLPLPEIPSIQANLLAWYDANRRHLPWRSAPGEAADPYRVWLSEIMLQQTVVATVIPYFNRFVARWPRVQDLAAARLDDVLTEWAGLGYYARARNLHKCAATIVQQHGGIFPDKVDSLLTLPGIGAYTAGAIAAIAFDRQVAAVDGNVERVTARLANIDAPLPGARPVLRAIAQSLAPPRRAGDFAQALMDLGSAICTPLNPKCLTCPISGCCAAFKAGDPGRLPVKAAKPVKPTRQGRVYWAVDRQGAVLLRRRTESGLLGGMMEFPSTGWSQDGDQLPPFAADWQALPGRVRHSFTHFHLELELLTVTVETPPPGLWVLPDAFGTLALPSVMRKVASHALRYNATIKG